MANLTFFLCNHSGKLTRKKNWNGKGFSHACRCDDGEKKWNENFHVVPGQRWTSAQTSVTCGCRHHEVSEIRECFIEVYKVQDKIGDIIRDYKWSNKLMESLKHNKNQVTQTPPKQQSSKSMEVDNLVQKVTLLFLLLPIIS